jgi:predicted ATPase/DNA-binding CsgD family transcriptional regulator
VSGESAHGGRFRSSAPTSVIGRDAEREDLVSLFQQRDVRLVTLVGPPGAGKTRLAQFVAESLGATLADGVVFVDLVPVENPGLVMQAIAAAVGIRDMGGRDIAESVATVLHDQELLLVLDNFEHVLEAALAVEELLTSCAGVRVLATSREGLGLTTEHQYRVAPLAVPSARDVNDLQTLASVPSVALFAMRARAVKHDWQLDPTQAAAVAELCRRLDGLPLAIELAAAWINVLSPRAVLARLDQGIDDQRGASGHRPVRHRSLADAIAWSYDLLADEERSVFERVSVFVGGWSLSAAETVCSHDGSEVLPVLARLINKHLVTAIEQPDGEPRFDMLVTLRAYARRRLAASGDEADTLRRHASYFLQLSEQAEPELAGQKQRYWLDLLEQEYDNLRAVLGWARDVGELEVALRLGGSLWFFWDMRGHLREGREWLARVLDQPSAQDPSPARVSALNSAGWLALVGGDYPAAIEYHAAALRLARQVDDDASVSRSAMHLAIGLGLGTQDFDRALALYDEALPIAYARGDLWTIGLTLYGQGHIAALRGDLEAVNRLWTECQRVCEGVHSLYALSYLQFRWGILALQAGALDRAQQHLLEALRFGDEVDSAREMGVAMDALAWVAVGKREVQRATSLFGAAQALLDRAGYNLPPFMAAAHERAEAAALTALGSQVFKAGFGAGRRLSRGDAIRLARGEANRTRRPAYEPLTEREWQVAVLVAQGQSNKQIAATLNIAERTVVTHLEHIFAKLEVQNRAQVAVWTSRLPSEADVELQRDSTAVRAVH